MAGKGARGLLRTGINRPDWTPAKFQENRDKALEELTALLATSPTKDTWNNKVSDWWGAWAITDTESDALAENPDFLPNLAKRSPWLSSRGRVQDPCGDIATPRESQACRDDEAAGGGARIAEAEASKYVRTPTGAAGGPTSGAATGAAGGTRPPLTLGGAGGLGSALPALLGALGGGRPGGLGPLGAAIGSAPLPALGGGPSLEATTGGAFLAEQLRRMSEQRDPTAQAGLAELGRRAILGPVARGQEAAARSAVSAVRDAVLPELQAVRSAAEQEQTQVLASAEHRERSDEAAWRRRALELLERARERAPARRF